MGRRFPLGVAGSPAASFLVIAMPPDCSPSRSRGARPRPHPSVRSPRSRPPVFARSGATRRSTNPRPAENRVSRRIFCDSTPPIRCKRAARNATRSGGASIVSLYINGLVVATGERAFKTIHIFQWVKGQFYCAWGCFCIFRFTPPPPGCATRGRGQGRGEGGGGITGSGGRSRGGGRAGRCGGGWCWRGSGRSPTGGTPTARAGWAGWRRSARPRAG